MDSKEVLCDIICIPDHAQKDGWPLPVFPLGASPVFWWFAKTYMATAIKMDHRMPAVIMPTYVWVTSLRGTL